MNETHPNAPGNGGEHDYGQNDRPRQEVVAAPLRAMNEQSLAADLASAEIDQQIATAHRFPRTLDVVVRKIRELACHDEAAADNSIYALPRGNKPIVGPSIGFANIVAAAWGNCRDGARITFVDRKEKVVIAEGVFHDLESNRLTIIPVQRRIVNARGQLYSDDMIIVTGMAAGSIARRNAILNAVPRAVWFPTYERALFMVRGTEATLPERREKAVKSMAQFGVEPKQVFKYLGVEGMGEIGVEHMPTLRGMFSQLRDQTVTVEEMFDPRKMAGVGFDRVENPLGDEEKAAQEGQGARQGQAPATGKAQGAKPAGKPASKAAGQPKGKKPTDKEGEPAPAKGEEQRERVDPGSGAGTAVGSTPVQEKPGEPEKKAAEEPKPEPPPKTPAEYEARANRFIDAATSSKALREAWTNKPERELRGLCRIVEEDFERIKERYDAKLRALESEGK